LLAAAGGNVVGKNGGQRYTANLRLICGANLPTTLPTTSPTTSAIKKTLHPTTSIADCCCKHVEIHLYSEL